MKPVMSESMSQLYVDYEALSFKDEYSITVTKFEPIVSINCYFEIDLQINIEVEVKGPQGRVILHGEQWFYELAGITRDHDETKIQMDDLAVKESQIEESKLDAFLRDIHDSRIEIKFPTHE